MRYAVKVVQGSARIEFTDERKRKIDLLIIISKQSFKLGDRLLPSIHQSHPSGNFHQHNLYLEVVYNIECEVQFMLTDGNRYECVSFLSVHWVRKGKEGK